MADWPASVFPAPPDSISVSSMWSLGAAIPAIPAAAAWPATNRALFVPFRVPVAVTVYKMACGTGTLTAGNFDLGIYDANGVRLVSTGTTAKTTASSERIVDVTDTLLLPGKYYLAMATDGTANYILSTAANLALVKLAGIYQMETAFALPATATFATATAGGVPFLSAYLNPA